MNKFEKIEKAVTACMKKATGKSDIYRMLDEAGEKFNCFVYADFPSEYTREYAGCIHFKVFNRRAGKVAGCIGSFNVRANVGN